MIQDIVLRQRRRISPIYFLPCQSSMTGTSSDQLRIQRSQDIRLIERGKFGKILSVSATPMYIASPPKNIRHFFRTAKVPIYDSLLCHELIDGFKPSHTHTKISFPRFANELQQNAKKMTFFFPSNVRGVSHHMEKLIKIRSHTSAPFSYHQIWNVNLRSGVLNM